MNDAAHAAPFPSDAEVEPCDECGGDGETRHGFDCGYCDGTGRMDGWVACEDCGEVTFDHETGSYQQCETCRAAEYANEVERRAGRTHTINPLDYNARTCGDEGRVCDGCYDAEAKQMAAYFGLNGNAAHDRAQLAAMKPDMPRESDFRSDAEIEEGGER